MRYTFSLLLLTLFMNGEPQNFIGDVKNSILPPNIFVRTTLIGF